MSATKHSNIIKATFYYLKNMKHEFENFETYETTNN